jgi:hypothetical protein
VSVLAKDGSVKDAVVVLKNPKLEGDKLSFTVQTLEGDLAGADGSAAIFIDIIGRPLTPLSLKISRHCQIALCSAPVDWDIALSLPCSLRQS